MSGSEPMRTSLSLIDASILSATPTVAEEVGSFANDWSGNDIVVEAFEDPEFPEATAAERLYGA